LYFLFYTAKKIRSMYSKERNCAKFPHSCVCERFTYIFPSSVHLFSCRRIGRPIVGIYYKSLTDSWMWKLRLRTHSFISGNICLEFSVLYRYSVVYVGYYCCVQSTFLRKHSYTSCPYTDNFWVCSLLSKWELSS
jgi:hypothetical protein